MLSQDNVNIIYYIYKAVYGKRVYATYTCQSLGEIRVTTHNIGLDQHRTFMTSQILCWILVRDGSQQLCQNSNTNWKVFSFSGWEDVCCRLQSQPQPGCLDRRAWWLVGTDAGFNSIQKWFYCFSFGRALEGPQVVLSKVDLSDSIRLARWDKPPEDHHELLVVLLQLNQIQPFRKTRRKQHTI